MNADGSGATRLAAGRSPEWSPDGAHIAFERLDDGVYVMNADGSGARKLADGRHPRLVPRRRRHAFERYDYSGDAGLYVIGVDGAGLARLTPSCCGGGAYDGPRVVAAGRAPIAWIDNPGLYVIDADGSDRARIAWADADPSWAPDSTMIAFDRDGDVIVVNRDGTGELDVTNRGWDEHGADWQPAPTVAASLRADAGGPYATDEGAPAALQASASAAVSYAWVPAGPVGPLGPGLPVAPCGPWAPLPLRFLSAQPTQRVRSAPPRQ